MASPRTRLAWLATTLLTVSLLAPGATAAFGQFGGLITNTEPDLVGWLGLEPGNATLVWVDDNPADSDVDTSEAVFIHFGGGTTIASNDFRVGPTGGKQVRTTADGQGDTFTVLVGYDIIFQDSLPCVGTDCVTTGPDGEFNPGEALFLDLTSDGVTTDDIRLSKTGAGAKATSTEATNAAGWAEISLGLPMVRALDADGSGTYNANDVLYFDVDNDEWATPGDVRLTSFGSLAYGTSPAINDLDTVQILDNSPSYSFLYDDEDEDSIVDAAEAILLDMNADGVGEADIAWGGGTGCTTGSALTTTSVCGDANVDYVDSGGALMHTGTAPFDINDALVLHFGETSAIAVGDLCLSNCPSSKAPGAKFTGTGAALTAVTGDIATFDLNANGVYDRLDLVYFDHDSNGFVTPGDVRLAALSSKTFGSLVKAGEADTVHLLTSDGPALSLGYLESGENGGLNKEDPIVLAAGSTTVSGDVRLTAGFASGSTAGSRVSGSDSSKPVVTSAVLGGVDLIFASTGQNSYITTADELYVTRDVASPDDTAGDAIITNGGARVTTPSNAVSLMEVTPTLAWLDVDGDGDIDGNDAGYLQFVDDTANPTGDAIATVGDVRFTGTASGTIVSPPATSNPPATSTSTATATATATSTDTATSTETSTATSTDTSTGTSTSTTTPDPASLNQQLADSLEVDRDDDDNVLTWDDVDGESGFQVFGSESPFVLIATLPAGTTTYRDEGASQDRVYVITAVVGDVELTAEQVNAGDVPGYSGVPEGEKADGGGKKGFIPGMSPVLLVGLLGLLGVLARRRLA
jgi:hypothetical protein